MYSGQRKRKNDIRIGSWNVRTLFRAGALKTLTDELARYKMDVTAVQEMRWLGSGHQRHREYDLYYSCHASDHMFGTGFIVGPKMKSLVIDFKPINERLCTLRMRGKFYNISVINVHAPTEEKTSEVKESFYEELDRAYSQCPSHDLKIVLGDFNAKLGREPIYSRCIGFHSLHGNTNDNGTRLVDFATEKNLVVGSTRFARRDIHKATWVSPDGVTSNQIDHVLTDNRHKSSLLKVRTLRGANIDSDHFLVGAVIRCRIANSFMGRTRAAQQPRFNTDALKDPRTTERYQEAIRASLVSENVNTIPALEETWRAVKHAVISCAQNVIGIRRGNTNRSGWFDDECRLVTERKNAAYRTMQQRHRTRACVEEYKRLRREEKRVHKRKKREWEEERICELQENRVRYGPSRKFYQSVAGIRRGYKPAVTCCRDKEGNLVTNQSEILRRWAQYFDELLNDQQQQQLEAPPAADNIILPPPSIDETRNAIRRLKNHKSPGTDGIPAELIKYGGEYLENIVHRIVTEVWDGESMPCEWNLGIICPIYKKGDALNCSNYRGITLLNTAYKIFSLILQERLVPFAERIVGDYQRGFRGGKSTTDQIFSMRQILEKMTEYGTDTHHLFVDFKAAYDSIARVKLYDSMSHFGIPQKLIRLTRLTMANVQSQVRIDGALSESVPCNKGLRQGDGLACLLFNISLERAVRDSGIRTRGTIFTKSTQILGYADDIDIIGRSTLAVKEAFVQIEAAATSLGLQVNEGKTKYMAASSASTTRDIGTSITIGDHNFEVVQQFTYLGSRVSTDNNITEDIRARVLAANRAYFSLIKPLKSRNVSRRTKLELYKSLIIPVLTYSSETWTLSSSNEFLLAAFERKILRRIFGPVCEEGRWRSRYNAELYNLYNDNNIVQRIKLGRLRWAGHVVRMREDDPARQVFLARQYTTRRRGRPRLRWSDGVDEDAEKIGIPNWRTQALQRDRWKKLLEEAKTDRRL